MKTKVMNEQEYREHSRSIVEKYKERAIVMNKISVLLINTYFTTNVLTALAILYYVWLDKSINEYQSFGIMGIVLVGIIAINLSYKYTNYIIWYIGMGYAECLYDNNTLKPIRIYSMIFIVIIGIIVFYLYHYPILSTILMVVSYFLLWVMRKISRPIGMYMFQ